MINYDDMGIMGSFKKYTGPPSRNSESPLIQSLIDTSRPSSDLPQGSLRIIEICLSIFVF